ncbi:MAG: hypothetical protein ABI968_15325 [Acidobacteriota bacterium]
MRRLFGRVWLAYAVAVLGAAQYACDSDSNTVTGTLDKGKTDVVVTDDTVARLDIIRPARGMRTPGVGPAPTSTPGGGGPPPTNTPFNPVPPTNTPFVPAPTNTPFAPPPPTSTPGGIPPTNTPPPPPPPTLTATPIPTQVPPPTATPGGTAIAVRLRAVNWQWDYVTGPSISRDTAYPGQNTVTLRVGQRYDLRIYNGGIPGTAPHFFGGSAALGLSGGALEAGDPDILRSFVPTVTGTFEFNCTDSGCGSGHDRMHAFIKVVP